MPFSAGMGLDFCIFLVTCKKSKKSNYIADEAVHSQMTRLRDDQTDRKETFPRSITLQTDLINQVDNDCF